MLTARMDAPPPPFMASTGFLSTASLLDSLVQICHEIFSTERLPHVQLKNLSSTRRRIKLLSSFFEEIQGSNNCLPPSCILCLTELLTVFQGVKLLIHRCKQDSKLWSLLQTHTISNEFYLLAKEVGKALDILPLSLLDITTDTKEQVELLRKQAKKVDLFVDPREVQRREELLQVITAKNYKNIRDKGLFDTRKVRDFMSSVGLGTRVDYEEEIFKLEQQALKQAGTGGLIVISHINSLISMVSYCKSMISIDNSNEKAQEPTHDNTDNFMPSQSINANIPDEFRCPISLDLMKDPVIIASGHTYDRHSIAQWINSGHHTCPKSGQRLIHMALIPNYALKSLVHEWCQENNTPLDECASASSDSEKGSSKKKQCEEAVDHISATKASVDAVKMTAEFLVGKLATGSEVIQRQAAYELRLLAKTGMDNRRIIAEAGAIPFLVTLLMSNDPQIQENSVTALLNLSIYDNNKILIMAASAVDNIVQVLESGKTMEARENAAATIFSLSLIDETKIAFGAHPRAITALVELIKEGNTPGKRDAAMALLNLVAYNANKAAAVVAGAVPLLIELLMDDKAGITDDALSVLTLLMACTKGLEQISKSRVLIPLLIDLLRFGSLKGKENSITLLLGLCKNDGEDVARRLLLNPRSIPSLQSLSADGSLRARRKAEAVLRLLNRCCSQSQIHAS
uniref:RING-type E3 ubiquitin transferase n=1 Tax=Kalanchoe fedtschenkoi TaxID=63787 RepID=A0A7N0RJQ9_KALFE